MPEDPSFYNPETHNRSRYIAVFYVFLVLVLAGLACNLPGGIGRQPDGEPGGRETMIAGTLTARAEGKALVDTDTPKPLPTMSPTPSSTDTPRSTSTPEPTHTADTARVHVSGDTFCRTGPGSVYDQRGIFNTGEESEIIAKDPTEGYWYVVNPDDPAQRCWIWGKYATPDGPTAGLPVFTPPPTPTPSLNFSYSYLQSDCATGQCRFWFEVKNTGGLPLESAWVHVESKSSFAVSTPTKEESTDTFNHFWDAVLGSTLSKVDVGKKGFTRSKEIKNPTGYKVNVSIKICSQDGLSGSCKTKNLSFGP